MKYCLDSWAVLRFLEDKEPAASRVEELLGESPVMSWINLGEVFYTTYRLVGKQQAQDAVRTLGSQLDLDLPSPERVIEAATIKANHLMSYADAFAIATALAHDAILLTGDPELLRADPSWPVEDLRRK